MARFWATPIPEDADFAPGQLYALLAEGERSIEEEGTLVGDEVYRFSRISHARGPAAGLNANVGQPFAKQR